MISPYVDASEGRPAVADDLNQLEFFLFLANSIEIDGELTTPADLAALPSDPMELTESEPGDEQPSTVQEREEEQP